MQKALYLVRYYVLYLRNDSNRKRTLRSTAKKPQPEHIQQDLNQLERALRSVTQLLDDAPLEAMAKATGFIRRKAKKLNATLFIQAAILLVTQSQVSLRRWAIIIGVLGKKTLSKQSLWERLTPGAVEFVKAALERVVSRKVGGYEKGILASLSFRRVLVNDSTLVALSPTLAKAFPGSANQCGTKKGQLRIQSVFDLVGQCFLHFSLSSFRRNDQAAAFDVMQVAQQGDLIIRDLGYFAFDAFAEIATAKAFFLSRFRARSLVYGLSGDKPIDLLKLLTRGGNVDMKVRLGEGRLETRLVAFKLSDAVAADRRRRAKSNRDKRCIPSARDLKLLGWAIFITNATAEQLPAKKIAPLYRLRWRIEIIFKTWKRHFQLTVVLSGTAEALQVLIYARLIFLAAFAQACALGWLEAGTDERPARSLLKVASLVSGFILILFLEAMRCTVTSSVLLQMQYHTNYEVRTRQSYADLLVKLS